ncbi:hypothetical protein [Streptomyces boluensis]|uniref:Histidine phosphatase family protein n=1 Tax=Streptomyces boluensis TaxID=1775135 RepID=A0A964UW34_9ACTN|nr:hypothetical protein [Streptomyces boluensis]NBE56494.1 hypothetical protein [Streptomyces boluensis]
MPIAPPPAYSVSPAHPASPAAPSPPRHDLTVLLIRHAEKPDREHPGVDAELRPDRKSLTARGWDRARKLPALFGPYGDALGGPELPLPTVVFAAGRHGPAGGARRLEQTVTPLAEQLGLTVRTDHGKTQERALARAATTAARSPVLICWQHGHIPALVRAFGAENAGPVPPPTRWPTERYDLVWVFTYEVRAGRWGFRQVGQGLLDGDRVPYG